MKRKGAVTGEKRLVHDEAGSVVLKVGTRNFRTLCGMAMTRCGNHPLGSSKFRVFHDQTTEIMLILLGRRRRR